MFNRQNRRKTAGQAGAALVNSPERCQGIIILSERPQGWSHTCHNSQHPWASRSLRLLRGNSSGMRTQDPSGGSWDGFVWIGMIMSTQAPAQAGCLDNFWALERANRSRSHWRQWKNSSSLQRALDPAHTAGVSDRESGMKNYSTEKTSLPPKLGHSGNNQHWICPAWKSPRWKQGAKNHPAAPYFWEKQDKEQFFDVSSTDFCPVFSIHILAGTSSVKALNSLLPRETLLTERNLFRASTHPK